MELTPQLLTDEIDFRIAVRGYDRNEVDDFLERVAVAVGQLQSQLTKAVARAKAAEARVAELEAGGAGTAPTTTAPAASTEAATESLGDVAASTAGQAGSSPVPKAPPSAPVPVVGGDEALNDELRRTLVLAQRTADTAIREAHEEARTIVQQADEEARRHREAAEEAHAKAREEAHGRLVAEIRELESTREAMRDDTVVLERYLGSERARVRETIQVLRRLVDEPESFRTGPIPELSGATTPAAIGPAPEPTDEDTPGDEASTGEAPAENAEVDGPADSVGDSAGPDADVADADEGTVDDGSAGAVAPDAETSGSEAAPTEPRPDEATQGEASPTASGSPGAEQQPRVAEGKSSGDDRPEGSDAAPEEAASDSARLGQLFGSSEAPKDWRSSGPDRGDQGPHTQPVAAARFEEESDEAFLAELRRAMSDDEPLGPGNADR